MQGTPERIWAHCTDPALPTENSTELQGARWDPDGPAPGLGARILGHNRRRSFEWRTVSTVVEWDPPRRWSYEVRSGLDLSTPLSQWWYTIEDHGDGTATVTHRVRLGPGPSGLTMAIERDPDAEEQIVEGRLAFLAGSMEANLRALARAVCEGPAEQA